MTNIDFVGILKEMDLPPARLDVTKRENLEWLKRNMFIRNSDHPRFLTAVFELQRRLV